MKHSKNLFKSSALEFVDCSQSEEKLSDPKREHSCDKQI